MIFPFFQPDINRANHTQNKLNYGIKDCVYLFPWISGASVGASFVTHEIHERLDRHKQ
jgi:hypothetical protein